MKTSLKENLQETKPDSFKIIPLKDYPFETISPDPKYTEEYDFCINDGHMPITSKIEMEKKYPKFDAKELADNWVIEENLDEPVLSSIQTETRNTENSDLNGGISQISHIDPNPSQTLQEEGINILIS